MEQQQVKVAVKEKQKSKDLLLLELVQELKEFQQKSLKVARLLHELHGLGMTDQAISEKLAQSGVFFERSTITTYRNIWAFFAAQMGLYNEIQDIPISHLMLVRRYALDSKADRERTKELLDLVRGKSLEQAKAVLREEFGEEKAESNFASIKVERPVYDMFEEAKMKLSAAFQTLGYEEASTTQVIEFMARLIVDTELDTLVALVRREMGE